MKWLVHFLAWLLLGATAQAQIQVELKFKRLQYIAHEPVIASIKITNLAGRDVDLHDDSGQHWFGFEVTAGEGRLLAPFKSSVADAFKETAGPQVFPPSVELTTVPPKKLSNRSPVPR